MKLSSDSINRELQSFSVSSYYVFKEKSTKDFSFFVGRSTIGELIRYINTPELMTIHDILSSRYATKHYEKEKKIPGEDIQYVLESMNLSASALGLQPYRFIVVDDEETKKKLAEHSFHGIDVADASHLIVIASMKNVPDDYIEKFIRRTEKLRGFEEWELHELEGLTKKIVHSIDDHFAWTQKQAYLVMGVLHIVAPERGIDMTPMEVFDREAYDRILGLDGTNYGSVLVGVLGYRKEGDPDQYLAKSRFPLSEIVSHFPENR